MKTYRLNNYITMTLTNNTAYKYEQALKAEANLRSAYCNEDLDWEDMEDLWADAFYTWEAFAS